MVEDRRKKEALSREDDEDEIMALNEGMTQKRGEATKDQDKFRVTVERESNDAMVSVMTRVSQCLFQARPQSH